ncbi:MAG TPA: TIGR03936 family radical SAM-associated protein, partial [Kofleriaceae bacterium]
SHVPKPHTPLQWAAQDLEQEIRRKQFILRDTARPHKKLRLKHHHSGISFVEGILARGDRRIADVVETVWRSGARFDGWDEAFDHEKWDAALAQHGVDISAYMGTRPVHARLPWDHIDVGLEDGFLLAEYRKALKRRSSPPCGKVAGMLIHHTNLEDAQPDQRKLVCYDCGVACDLTKMRSDRLVALDALGATARPQRASLPVVVDTEMVDVSERGGGSPAERAGAAPEKEHQNQARKSRDRETERAERVRMAGHHGVGLPYTTYRLGFAKIGRASFLGHLDMVRLLSRSFRRADLPLAQTRGFSPKPRITFGPALGLGVPSLGEVLDVDLEHVVPGMPSWEAPEGAPRIELAAEEVRERLASVCPPGIEIASCHTVRLTGHPLLKNQPGDAGLGKWIDAVDIVIRPAPDGITYDAARVERLANALIAKPESIVTRGEKSIDVRQFVRAASVISDEAARRLCAALDWPESPALFRVRVSTTSEGSAKPSEVARALGVWGPDDLRAEHAMVARLGVVPIGAPDALVATPLSSAAIDRVSNA